MTKVMFLFLTDQNKYILEKINGFSEKLLI